MFVRDNYGFVTFANYDGACAAVERKLFSFLLLFQKVLITAFCIMLFCLCALSFVRHFLVFDTSNMT